MRPHPEMIPVLIDAAETLKSPHTHPIMPETLRAIVWGG